MKVAVYLVECEDKKDKFVYASCNNLEEAEEKLKEAKESGIFKNVVYFIEKITFERISQ